ELTAMGWEVALELGLTEWSSASLLEEEEEDFGDAEEEFQEGREEVVEQAEPLIEEPSADAAPPPAMPWERPREEAVAWESNNSWWESEAPARPRGTFNKVAFSKLAAAHLGSGLRRGRNSEGPQ
ncbi:unnamed protein product, partial [Polarella glacialis]